MDDFDFARKVLEIMIINYDEIYGTEEVNVIDLGGWNDFIDENNIEYDEDGFFPIETIWSFINLHSRKVIPMVIGKPLYSKAFSRYLP